MTGERVRLTVFVVVLAVWAHAANAAVAVLLEALSTGSGHHILVSNQIVPDSVPTTYTDMPFPDDAQNSVTTDGNDLHVRVNRKASHSHAGIASNLYADYNVWTIEKFAVTFQLDQPAAFSFSYTPLGPDPLSLHLKSNGTEFLTQSFGTNASSSGLLPPGEYSFTGSAGNDTILPKGGGGIINTVDYPMKNVVLDVTPTPEPGTVSVLALLSVVTLGRRRDR